MKRALLLMLFPVAALAATPFDGTWKLDYSTMHITKNAEYGFELKGGTYRCTKNCDDKSDEVAADGKDHPIKNHVVSDHLAVEVVNDTTVALSYKKGATVVVKCTNVAAADGKHLTQACTDYTGEKPVESKSGMTRVGKADPAAHKISGTWAGDDGTNGGSDVVMTIQGTANGVKFVQNGMITDGKFDGKDYPTQNDPAHSMNTFKQLGERKLEWLGKTQGRPSNRDILEVAADGKTLTDSWTDLRGGMEGAVIWRRQP